MPFPIEIISLGEDNYESLDVIAKLLNSAQKEFLFNLPPLRLRGVGQSFQRNVFHTVQVYNFLKQYRIQAGGHRPFLIAFVNGPLQSNNLSNIFGSHEAKEGLAVVTLQDQLAYTKSKSAFICYYFIRYALSFLAPELISHPDTRSCFFDRKINKSDLLKSLGTGSLCDSCRSALQKHFNQEVYHAVVEMVARLKQLVSKANHPVSATDTILPQDSVTTGLLMQNVGLDSLENGTNVAVGTPYLEPASRMLPWYIPSTASGNSNWRASSVKLRDRFEKYIDEHCTSECFLVQTIIPAFGGLPLKPPGILPDRKPLLSAPGLELAPAKLVLLEKNAVAKFPVPSVHGELMLQQDGSPVPFRLGLSRYMSVFAVPDGARTLPVPKLTELIGDGQNLLFQLPSKIAVQIWKNWPNGFSQRNSEYLWLDALYELSWQRERGAPFHVGRFAWFENASVGLSGNGLFPRLPNFITSSPGEFAPHVNGYPRSFYSKIPDIARASIAAINQLLSFDVDIGKDKPVENAAKITEQGVNMGTKNKVFISYCHKDKKFLDELLTHLKPIERSGQLTSWSDKKIEPGSKWFDEIEKELSVAKVAVLLVTANFLASNFIHEHELMPLLKKAAEGGVRILWIPVRACSYKDTPINKYQAISSPDKPLAQMKAERDKAWVLICEKIQQAVANIL